MYSSTPQRGQEPGSHSLSSQETAHTLDSNVVRLEPALAPYKKEWLNIDEAAAYLGKSKRTLYNWNARGTGPRRKTVYGRLFYHIKDLEAHRRQNTDVHEAFT